MIDAKGTHHSVIFRDPYSYCAHPSAAVAPDGSWLVVFNQVPRRAFVMHPPEDPLYRNLLIRSHDQGLSWSRPQVVPDYTFAGTECAGLTVLANGIILLNQWCFDWYPLGLAHHLPRQEELCYPETFIKSWMSSPEHDVLYPAKLPFRELAPWVRGGGQTWVHRSMNNGTSFTDSIRIDTKPFSGGYGMRSGVVLPDGDILLLLSDIPNYRQIFVLRGNADGTSWANAKLVAAGAGHEFEEPTIALCHSGKLIAILRDNGSRFLHQVESDDEGETWSSPRKLDITGYPAHLLVLGDGRLLMTYGWRQPDYGIRAVVSDDEGASWNTTETIRIRGGLPNKNLGYPSTIPFAHGKFATIYYGEDSTGTTCIISTIWEL